MGRVLRYILFMTPGMAIGAILWLVLLGFRRKRLSIRGFVGGREREWAMALFWMFSGGMAVITLAPEPGWVFDLIYWARRGQLQEAFAWFGVFGGYVMPLEHRINLIPFAQGDSLFNIIGNVVMFLPFGFFAALLWRGATWRLALGLGLGITVSIECRQILAGRYFDIDDIILNTLGVFCGYLLWALLDRCAPEFAERFHVKERTRG